ncbi:MAG: lipocalin-like domain-containing protein [Chloroflexota bacterium]
MFTRPAAQLAAALALFALLLVPSAAPAGAASPQNGALVRMPADDRNHPRSGTEWWYLVGHLRDAAGHRYGYEAVVFRFGHLRSAVPGLGSDTVYRADTAFTDEGAHTFSGAPHYLRSVPGTTAASDAQLGIHAGPIAMARLAARPALSYAVRETAPDGTRLNLTVTGLKPAILVGGAGLIPMGTRGSSYYYSLTELRTRGTLLLHGRGRPIAVSGLSWMDHQWGDWDWSGINGWDWMAVQLQNHTELNVTDFVGGRGSAHKAATVSLPGGGQMVTLRVMVTPVGHWRSPLSHILYPSGWRVRAPDLGLDVVVRPTVQRQEMTDRFAPDQSYWEGSCTVEGTQRGRPVSGWAYTELAGYGTSLAPLHGGAY